jgi:hypothetical protein
MLFHRIWRLFKRFCPKKVKKGQKPGCGFAKHGMRRGKVMSHSKSDSKSSPSFKVEFGISEK